MIDENVGRVIQALRESGLEQDTVVILAADHGEALGDHGMWGKGPYHFDSVIRVPLVFSWPGEFAAGAICSDVVSLLDFAPTILDTAGVPIPRRDPSRQIGLARVSCRPGPDVVYVPLLRGNAAQSSGRAVVEDDQDDLGLRLRTLVTERYRLTVYAGQDYGELFDLHEDPDELRNLWADAGYKNVRTELIAALLDTIIATDHALPRRMGSS